MNCREKWGFSLLAILALLISLVAFAAAEEQEETWRERFDRICAKTEAAGDLPAEELSALVAESNELLEVIRNLDDPKKKLFLFRLEKCRNMFQYILDLKARNGSPGETPQP